MSGRIELACLDLMKWAQGISSGSTYVVSIMGNTISASRSWCVERDGRTVPTLNSRTCVMWSLCFHDELQHVYVYISRGVLANADHFVVLVYVKTCAGKR